MSCSDVPCDDLDIDKARVSRCPYQLAYLPVNCLKHDSTLWNW